jgi:hypothetical protein
MTRSDPVLSPSSRSPAIQRMAALTHNRLERLGTRPPGVSTIERLLHILYHCSLYTEEAQHLRMRLTVLSRKEALARWRGERAEGMSRYVPFGNPLTVTPETLRKLALAADPFASSVAVQAIRRALVAHGIFDQSASIAKYIAFEAPDDPERPGLCDIEITGLGSLRVWHKYHLIADLHRGALRRRYLDVMQHGPIARALRRYIRASTRSLRGKKGRTFWSPAARWDAYANWHWVGTLSRILLRMQRYGRGGAVLIVPGAMPRTQLNVKYRLHYKRLPAAVRSALFWTAAYNWSSKRVEDAYRAKRSTPVPMLLHDLHVSSIDNVLVSREETAGCVGLITALSRVDGAVVLDESFAVRGFGVELRTPSEPRRIWMAQSTEAGRAALRPVDPRGFGTRHRSMFRFCFANSRAIGFVVSQDGDVRCVKNVGGRVVCWENVHVWSEVRLPMRRRSSAGNAVGAGSRSEPRRRSSVGRE